VGQGARFWLGFCFGFGFGSVRFGLVWFGLVRISDERHKKSLANDSDRRRQKELAHRLWLSGRLRQENVFSR